MKSFFHKAATALIVTVLVGGTARSQVSADLSQMAKIGSEVVKGWVSPLASGFGNGLNTAFYHSADLHDVLGFDIGLKIGAVSILDEDKTYSFSMPSTLSLVVDDPILGQVTLPGLQAGLDYPATITANSAVGDAAGTPIPALRTISVPGKTINAGDALMMLPGGASLPVTGAFAPQAAIGLPFGLEVIGRFLPTMDFDGNKLGLTGFGLRYDVDQWLPLFPIDIAVHFATQKMTLKGKDDNEVFSAGATAFGVEASKKFLFITLYTGFQLESSKITFGDITYVGTDAFNNPVNLTLPGFEVEGSNSSRFTIGVRMLLLIVNVHAEYSLAKNPVLGLGAGFSIR